MRAEITMYLSQLTERHINPKKDSRIYWAKEVTFSYSTGDAKRVDYMQYKPLNNSISGLEKGDFYCFEIKSSVEDFNSQHGHNFFGDFNYYVMLEETYAVVKDKIPHHVGVYVASLSLNTPLVSVKNAKRCSRSKSALEMIFMMFRSSNRDKIAYEKMLQNGVLK